MSDRTLPLPASSDVSTVTILSDGTEVSREIQILSIVVDYAVNRVPTATIILLDGDVSAQEFPVSNLADFAPGREIEIQAGYHSTEETIFKGLVVRHAVRSKGRKSAILSVVCKDPVVKMTAGRRSAYFYESADGDILDQIISGHGLTAEIDDMSVVHKGMVQYQATDWDFLISRAEMNGKLVTVRDGTVMVRAPDTGQDPVLTLEYGATIIEFEAELDAETQWAAVTTTAWDFAGQATVEVEGADPGLAEQGNVSASDLSGVIGLDSYRLHSPAALAEDELGAWGDGLLLRSRLAKVRGRVRCQGIGVMAGDHVVPFPGDVIQLEGVGDRFNGVAFVSAVRHEFTPGNWVTDLQIGLDPALFNRLPDIRPPLAGGLLPPIEGLHIGIVTRLEGDPDGENRIQVRLPLIDPEGEGLWARIATLDAGENRGTFFLPEIEDEVVIGFLYGDPRQPVVMGMMNSSAKPAALTAADANPQKGYISREDIRMLFDDETVTFTLTTPGGRVITVDDDAGEIKMTDEAGNTVTINDDGITLDSPGDIKLTAQGDIKLSGTNIEVAANAEAKVDGGASGTFSSGGTTTVKGSLVQIN